MVNSFELSNGCTLSVNELNEKEDTKGFTINIFDKDGEFNQHIANIVYDPNTNQIEIGVTKNIDSWDRFSIPILNKDNLEDISDKNDFESAYVAYGDNGAKVKEIQRRLKELGYFDGVIGGNYLNKTAKAVEDFQLTNGLHVDGSRCDKDTYNLMMSKDAKEAEVYVATYSNKDQLFAKKMDWWTSNIQKIFYKGCDALITDVETGLQWHERRKGGTNHADVQPLTKSDTANLKKAYKGRWAWTRRAIWVTINGVTYAASMNGMPHGSGSISGNGFDGHHCIHFTNSRTHCSNKVCKNHQKMIEKAATTQLTI